MVNIKLEDTSNDRVHPYFGLLQGEFGDTIVLFTSKNTGIVVEDTGGLNPDSYLNFGHYSNMWQEDEFEAHSYKLTIETKIP